MATYYQTSTNNEPLDLCLSLKCVQLKVNYVKKISIFFNEKQRNYWQK